MIAKGYLAVDLFFILLGAVLYLVYAGEMRSGRFSFTRFAWRRVARLYPVHLVTLAAAVVILQGGAALGVRGRPLPYDLSEMAVLHLSLLHAWGITPTGGLNYPSWSLSAEAFAYLLFPLLAAVVLRLRPGTAVALSTLSLLGFAGLLQSVWPVEWRPAAGDLVLTRMENDFGALRILPEFCLGLEHRSRGGDRRSAAARGRLGRGGDRFDGGRFGSGCRFGGDGGLCRDHLFLSGDPAVRARPPLRAGAGFLQSLHVTRPGSNRRFQAGRNPRRIY